MVSLSPEVTQSSCSLLMSSGLEVTEEELPSPNQGEAQRQFCLSRAFMFAPQPQSLSPLSLPTLALRWDGWQLLCQGSLSRLSLTGCGKGYTDTVVKGSLEQQKFLIFYIR